MNKIYIDTALFAVPNYAVDAQTGQEIIDRVIHFSEIVAPEFPLMLIVADEAEILLWGNNLGPDFDQIDQFLELMELKHIYSTNDLLQRYQLLFQHCARASEVNILEVLDVASVVAEPALPEVAPADLLRETQRVFATAAALSAVQRPLFVGSAFYSCPHTAYNVTSTLTATGGKTPTLFDPLPAQVQAPVSMFTHLKDLISADVADELWYGAETAHDLHLSITLGALALQRQAGEVSDFYALAKFSIGSEFLNSLKQVECWGHGRYSATTRDLCSQIISGKCNRQINPFSLKDQYIRGFDGARAWRTHVTNSGLALRLMYWQGVKGIEFATVDVKGGERIDTGSEVPASAIDFRGLF